MQSRSVIFLEEMWGTFNPLEAKADEPENELTSKHRQSMRAQCTQNWPCSEIICVWDIKPKMGILFSCSFNSIWNHKQSQAAYLKAMQSLLRAHRITSPIIYSRFIFHDTMVSQMLGIKALPVFCMCLITLGCSLEEWGDCCPVHPLCYP